MRRGICRNRALAAAVALGVGSVSHAAVVADYFFNGPISYDAGTQALSVATGVNGAQIFSSTGLPAADSVTPATIAGSEVVLSMNLVAGSVVDNGISTTANFTTAGNYIASLYLGNGSGGTAASPVLTGTLSNLQVSGFDGNNAGVLTGYLHPTGGLAGAYFSDPSDVIALNFDLSTSFSSSMYASGFTGQINGQVEASPVPVPGGLPLFLCGIGFLGIVGRRRPILVSAQ